MSETSETSDLEVSTESRVWRDGLLQYLDQIKSVGEVAVSNRHTAFPNPGLQIEGNRIIPLPLTPTDAEAIKSVATQSTYGTGDQNVVDTSVRKTWELQPNKFQLSNPEWESYLDSHVLEAAAAGLGLEKVTARLCKLLLYEKGSFFKRHMDSETEPDMVGTLVVCLPSRHQGGDVHISFRSEKRTLATDTTSTWDITALAWYSDVTHEVAELTDGYRLVLTYKLVQVTGPQQSAQFFYGQLEGLRTMFAGWDDAATRPIYYPLDHLYPEKALSIDNLKGRDRAVCQVLHDACSDSGVLVFLASIKHIQWHDDGDGRADEETCLEQLYTCDGVELASGLRVDQEDILIANPFGGDPDDETEGGYVNGRDTVQGNSRYYYTVAMLLPRGGLHVFASGMGPEQGERVVSMLDEQLRNHRNAAVETAAVAVFNSAVRDKLTWPPTHATSPTVQTVLRWALELNNDDLYKQAVRHGLLWLDTQDAVLSVVGRQLQGRSAQHSETIEWEKLFGGFTIILSLAAWQRIVEQFPSHLESQHLRNLFKAWGEAKMVEKFDTQSAIPLPYRLVYSGDCGSDCSFLIKSIESRPANSEWITTRLFPALASRGSPELLYEILGVFFTRRESRHFAFAKDAFEYIIQHALSKLVLRTVDLEYGEKKRKSFVALLDQCLSIGANEKAMQLLEASSHELETNTYILTEAISIVSELLMPTALLLKKHSMSNLQLPAKTFFVAIIRGHLFRKIPASPLDWAHEARRCELERCGPCDSLGQFLSSKTEKTWRFDADEASREHIKHVLSKHGDYFEMTTECSTVPNAAPNTLVVVKSVARVSGDAKTYNQGVERLKSALVPLNGDTMIKILGDDDYRKLICLESMKVEDDAKRQADEAVEGLQKKLKIAG